MHMTGKMLAARQLLGKKVIVTLEDLPGKPAVIVQGTLLGVGDGGNFEILEEDGFVHYCWPLLSIREDA